MNIIDIILLAVALAMDCFTVSIVSGLTSHLDKEKVEDHGDGSPDHSRLTTTDQENRPHDSHDLRQKRGRQHQQIAYAHRCIPQ